MTKPLMLEAIKWLEQFLLSIGDQNEKEEATSEMVQRKKQQATF